MTKTSTPVLSTRLSKAGWKKQPTVRNKLPTGKTQYTLIWTHPDGRMLMQRDHLDVDGKVGGKGTTMTEANGTISISFGTATLVQADVILLGQFNI